MFWKQQGRLFTTWLTVQIVVALELTHPDLVFQRGKTIVVVVSTIARAFSTPMECRRSKRSKKD